MTALERIRNLVARSEVDGVERGHDHVLSMSERIEQRRRQDAALRGTIDNQHENLLAAVKRRARLLR